MLSNHSVVSFLVVSLGFQLDFRLVTMYYLKQTILLLSFVILILEISRLTSFKNEMEVTYVDKQSDPLPVVSVCTFMEYLQKNCENKKLQNGDGLKTSPKIDLETEGNARAGIAREREHCEHNPTFLNKTTRELFDFERRCAFLDEHHLIYVFNNTYHKAVNITAYLNFGLFCKLYEFDSNLINHNDGFFKIDSADDSKYKVTIFMHEKITYPTDINLKVSMPFLQIFFDWRTTDGSF